jgi:hypothetical protein
MSRTRKPQRGKPYLCSAGPSPSRTRVHDAALALVLPAYSTFCALFLFFKGSQVSVQKGLKIDIAVRIALNMIPGEVKVKLTILVLKPTTTPRTLIGFTSMVRSGRERSTAHLKR